MPPVKCEILRLTPWALHGKIEAKSWWCPRLGGDVPPLVVNGHILPFVFCMKLFYNMMLLIITTEITLYLDIFFRIYRKRYGSICSQFWSRHCGRTSPRPPFASSTVPISPSRPSIWQRQVSPDLTQPPFHLAAAGESRSHPAALPSGGGI